MQNHVVAQDAFLHRADAQDGGARFFVQAVGFQFNPDRAQGFKGMGHQQQLGLGVGAGALVALRQPGPADLQPAVGALDVGEAGAADDFATGLVKNGEGKRGALALEVEGLRDPVAQLGLVAALGLSPAPDFGVVGDCGQALEVVGGQRFKADDGTLQGGWGRVHWPDRFAWLRMVVGGCGGVSRASAPE